MSRIYVMTLGMFLIFLGVQVFLVKAYILTPDASRFVAERFEDPDAGINSADYYSPYSQAGFQSNFRQPAYSQGYNTAGYSAGAPVSQRSLAPPSWLCWPIFFFGAVVFFHGLALKSRN